MVRWQDSRIPYSDRPEVTAMVKDPNIMPSSRWELPIEP